MPDETQCCTSKLISDSTSTQLIKQRPQHQRVALIADAFLAYAIQLRIPYTEAGEFIPVAIVKGAIKKTLDVLCHLIPRTDYATTTQPPHQHQSDQRDTQDDSGDHSAA